MTGATDRQRTTIVVALTLLAALAFRLGLLDAPGEFDEFYHLLAARGLVDVGLPRIMDGEYWRGILFTRMVAAVFELTGSQGLPAARLVSVAAGVAIPAVLVWWLLRVAGTGSAILAGLFAVLWPQGILEAQFVRFYAVQGLCFLAGATALHIALDARPRARLALLTLTLGFWALALHFQISTAIGIAGSLGGAAMLLARRFVHGPRGWIVLGAILVTLLMLGGAVVVFSGLGEKAVAFYRWTPEHAEHLRDYRTFYFDQLEQTWGPLWYATPGLMVPALWLRPRLAVYCGAVFGTCFIAHSFGGMKALRYLSYAMPFLFAIWALGLVGLVQLIFGMMRPATAIGVGAACAALLLTAPFAWRSLELARGQSLPPRGDWRAAQEVLGDWADAPYVATTRELHHLAHIGPYDILFGPGRISELIPPEDFANDIRTGRPVVGSTEGWGRVLDCHPDGLLVTSPYFWEVAGWGARLQPLFDARGYLTEMRQDGALLALRWTGTAGAPCDIP
ncbi:hypothetical protein [Jannaschia rubra]|uniref:hypothetical protein n=1 Tax=Jannaschia rubra TaxID=282197 RepID=UPI002490F596|nr:hypothetical protein [Jannaschia rubra]